jgi:hypothetical protein
MFWVKNKKIKIDEEGILRGCGEPCLRPGDPGEGEGGGCGGWVQPREGAPTAALKAHVTSCLQSGLAKQTHRGSW